MIMIMKMIRIRVRMKMRKIFRKIRIRNKFRMMMLGRNAVKKRGRLIWNDLCMLGFCGVISFIFGEMLSIF